MAHNRRPTWNALPWRRAQPSPQASDPLTLAAGVLSSPAPSPAYNFPSDWQPRSVAQAVALACPAEILLFGGAAGSLKSETILVDAIAERNHSRLRAVLFRRSYPELEKSLILRSRELYAAAGGVYHEQKKLWRFSSGASVEFAYCESDKDIYRYQGAEYSFIAFDESTHFSEFPIRYMLSRLRSTAPGLRLRVRLASNPGNLGHAMHKALFHGETCTHCHLGPRSRHPFLLYHDAVWPSDRRPIGKSTCFIPGRVTDHSLLGDDYLASLGSLPGAFRKALLDGCWDVYEGQYFDNWDSERMLVKRALAGIEDWWTFWVAADYGFNVSQAAAYLFAISPDGRTYVVEEYTARHQQAADFARALRDRFALPGRRIVAWFLSPDAWADRGDGHSLADQMSEAARVPFTPASNDRLGGAMLVYSRLDSGQLLICDSCRELRQAIPTRIHDPKRPDDILKAVGDPLDDCLDALRYGVYSFISPPRPTPQQEIQAAITSRDPTMIALQHRVAEARLRQQYAPHRYMGCDRRRYRD
ncbi:MAG: terminase large subunit domain-containing protein [Terriglobales bacterium]